MKKILAILAAVMVLLSCSGCSQTEIKFYGMLKEMGSLNNFSFTGETALTLNKLEYTDPTAMEESNDYLKNLKDTLNGAKLQYSGAVSSDEKTLSFKLNLKKADNTTTEVVDMIAEGTYVYVREEPIKALLGNNYDAATMPAVIQYKGANYYRFDLKDLVESICGSIEASISSIDMNPPTTPDGKSDDYVAGYTDGYHGGIFDYQNKNENYKDNYQQNTADYKAGYDAGYGDGNAYMEAKVVKDAADIASFREYKQDLLANANAAYIIKLFKNIFFKAIDNAGTAFNGLDDLNLVTSSGTNGYALHLDNSNFSEAAAKAMDYLSNHADLLVSAVKAFLNSLTNEEMIYLGINPAYRAEIISGIDSDLTDFSPEEGPVFISDWSYDYRLQKTGDATYTANDTLSAKMPNPEEAQLKLNDYSPEDDYYYPIDFDFVLTNTLTVTGKTKETTSTTTTTTKTTGTKPVSPTTGDSSSAAWLFLPLGCAAFCVVLRRRQKFAGRSV